MEAEDLLDGDFEHRRHYGTELFICLCKHGDSLARWLMPLT